MYVYIMKGNQNHHYKNRKKIHTTVYNLCSRRQIALGMVINKNDKHVIDNKI